MQRIEDVKKGLACHALCRADHLPCSDCAYHGPGLPPCGKAVHEDAVALIEQLEAQVPKWISSDDPPKYWRHEDKDKTLINYLVYMPEYGVDVGNYLKPAKRWVCMGIPAKVTHWMPLPEEPKEDGK